MPFAFVNSQLVPLIDVRKRGPVLDADLGAGAGGQDPAELDDHRLVDERRLGRLAIDLDGPERIDRRAGRGRC